MKLEEKVDEILKIFEAKKEPIEVGTIKLKSGQEFEIKGGQLSKDRYGDGKDWYYFETLSRDKPKVQGAKKYHTFL